MGTETWSRRRKTATLVAVGVALLAIGALVGGSTFRPGTSLSVDTEPPGGVVALDGQFSSATPKNYHLEPGTHSLVVALSKEAIRPVPRNLKTVRTAYIPLTAYLPLYVALERHYFERFGLKVEAIEANSPNDILTGIASGQLDFASSLAYTILFPGEGRYPGSFKLFSSSEETRDKYTSSIIVPKGSPIRNYQGLRGKKIGVYQGIVQVIFLKAILEGMGISPAEVTIVEISPRLQIQGLVSGQYDALSTTEPTVNVAVIEGIAEVLIANPRTQFVMSPFPSTAAAVSTKLLNTDPEAAKGIVQALNLAVEMIQRDPQVAKQYLSKYTPIPQSISKAVLADLKLFKFNKLGEGNRLNVQRFADYLYEKDLMSKKIPDVNVLFGDYEPRAAVGSGGQ